MSLINSTIHQVWFRVGNGSETPPVEYHNMISSLKRHHPDWSYMLWDLPKARKLLQDHYPEYLEMFNGYSQDIYRIDAIRYFILYHYGGAYLDIDITQHRSLNPLRCHQVVLALNKYTKTRVNNNHLMMAQARHPFFKACIEGLPQASRLQTRNDSFLSVMGTAGPFYLSAIATQYAKRNLGQIYVLPYTEEVKYLTHHEKHSWKLAKNIMGDVIRATLVAGSLLATTLATKEITIRHLRNLKDRKSKTTKNNFL